MSTGNGHKTETPDVSHIRNVDCAYEASDINVRGVLTFVRNEQQRGHRLYTVQIEREIFERVTISFFRPDQLRRLRAMADWKIAEQAPEQFAAFLLVRAEFSFCFDRLRGDHWGTA